MAKNALDTFLARYGKTMGKSSVQQSNDDKIIDADNDVSATNDAKQSPMPTNQPSKKRNRFKVEPKPEQVYKGKNPKKIAKESQKVRVKGKNTSTNKKSDRPKMPPLQKKASSAVKIALFAFLKDNNKEATKIYMEALQDIPAQKIELAFKELASEIQLTDKQQKAYHYMLKNVKKNQYENRKKQREKSDSNQSNTGKGDKKMADTNENKDVNENNNENETFTLNEEQKKFLKDNHIDEQPESEEAFNKLKNEYEDKLKEALDRTVQLEQSSANEDELKALQAQKENDEKLIEKSDRSLVNKLLSDMENNPDYNQDAVKAIKKRYPESLNVSEEETNNPVPVNTPQQEDDDWVKEKDDFYREYAGKHPEFKYTSDENVKGELVAEMNGAKVHYASKNNVSVSKEANTAVFEAMLEDPHNKGRMVNFAENMSEKMQARLYAACLLHGNELGTGAPQQLSEEQLDLIKEDLGEERYAEFVKLHNARQTQQPEQQQIQEEQKFDKEKINTALDEQVEMAKLANKKDRNNDESNRLTELKDKDINTKAFLAAQYALNPEGFKEILKEKLTIKKENINDAVALRETQISAIRATKDQEELQKKEASRQDTRAYMAYKMGIIGKEKAKSLGLIDENGNAEHDINTGEKDKNKKDIVIGKGTEIKQDTNTDKNSVAYQAMLRRFGNHEK